MKSDRQSAAVNGACYQVLKCTTVAGWPVGLQHRQLAGQRTAWLPNSGTCAGAGSGPTLKPQCMHPADCLYNDDRMDF